jgi:hypothetical protein
MQTTRPNPLPRPVFGLPMVEPKSVQQCPEKPQAKVRMMSLSQKQELIANME